jgi:hypothetical protein
MALAKCELCEKPFNSFGGKKLCGPCTDEVDKAYVIVRKYIYQNPGKSDFMTIVEATGVPEKVLNCLIDQGRIVTADRGGGKAPRCKACGVPIQEGVLCPRCKSKLISQKLMSSAPDGNSQQNFTGKRTQPLGTPWLKDKEN